ncbi:MAG TPA: rhamnogalacturonan acetylesterase [Pirellulales bacterium]|nr:rhamnogalacturonan acetylesterase [Pirellulales bacterium]
MLLRMMGGRAERAVTLLMAWITGFAVCDVVGAANAPTNVRIVLVGDSTVTDDAGWGNAFAALLKPGAECVNLARGGQSSKSFYDGGRWRKALELKPDYVLIQFGHNDQPGKGANRETDAKTTFREYLVRYIDEARSAGAQPILVTSLVRRIFGPDGKLVPDLEPYAEAMRAVAADKQVPLVDLHARSKALVERLGPEKVLPLGPAHPNRDGKIDGTHLSAEGAATFAPLVAAELWNAVPQLRPYLPEPAH